LLSNIVGATPPGRESQNRTLENERDRVKKVIHLRKLDAGMQTMHPGVFVSGRSATVLKNLLHFSLQWVSGKKDC
jgi:hypothetical protein